MTTTMPSDTGDTAMAAPHGTEAEPAADATTAAPANALFQPEIEEMHISPHPPKRPLDGARSPNLDLSYGEPAPKRSRIDGAQYKRRSRSPQAAIFSKNKAYRERSRSRSQDHSRDRSRDRSRDHSRDRSRSRSRSHSQRYTRSPDTRRSQRDSTPPFRRRRSSGASATIPEPESRDTRRKASISQEEKKRGQRLFGGLFNALGQPTARARIRPGPGSRGPGGVGGSANRQPTIPDRGRPERISDRQQERPQPSEEDRKNETERLVKLERIRKIEQVRFDEKKMKTVHANDLLRAQSLSTKSKPSLLYRPKNLTQEQEQTIASQVQAAKDQISKQLSDFENGRQTRLASLGIKYTPQKVSFEASTPHEAGSEAITIDDDSNDGAAVVMAAARPQRGGVKEAVADDNVPNLPVAEIHIDAIHDDKDKGILVEHEEDTVMY